MPMQVTRLPWNAPRSRDCVSPVFSAINERAARSIAANARDLLGGNGILIQNEVARHFADIEAIHTYEGTETVQGLIIGREITGTGAFV